MRLFRAILITLALLAAAAPLVALAQTDGEEDSDGVLVRVDGNAQVGDDERIGVVVVVDGDLAILGTVTEVVVVVDGNAVVQNGAVVEGEIWLYEGTLTLRDGSRVDGDIYLGSDASLVMETGSTHSGELRDGEFDWDPGAGFVGNLAIFSLASWAATTLVVVLGAVVFAGIGGLQLLSTASYLTGRLGGTLIATVVFWLGLVLISGLLFVTLLGIPLVWMLWLIAGFVWFLGYLVFATRVGAAVMRRPLDEPVEGHPYSVAIAGALIMQMLVLLVFIGFFLALATAALSGSPGLWGALFGIPTILLATLLWLAGLIGGGAIVYRAYAVWSGRPVGGEHVRPEAAI